MNSLLTERLPLIGTIDPQTITDTEIFSDVIDMGKYLRVRATFLGGNMDAGATLTCRAVTCDADGNNAAALKTATALTAGTDNGQVEIEVTNEDLAGGGANADRYIKFGAVSAGSGGPVACAVYGEPFELPATGLASVAEIEIDKD